MDPKHTGEIFKHLEKQNELLMEAYNSMSHELHKLQVEEEMLMRKFYELMASQTLTRKSEHNANVSDGGQTEETTAVLSNTNDVSDDGEIGQPIDLVPTTTSNEQQ